MKASEAQPIDDQKGGSILKWKTLRPRPASQEAQLHPHPQGTESAGTRSADARSVGADPISEGTESLDCSLHLSFWCERLNRIPGLSTVHSSPGHRSIEGHLLSGHLWMILDEGLERNFPRMVFSLSREIQYVERVSRIYTSWGQQIVEIVFAGRERGLLNESMKLIVDFFEVLAEMSDKDSV